MGFALGLVLSLLYYIDEVCFCYERLLVLHMRLGAMIYSCIDSVYILALVAFIYHVHISCR
jgi:hypothetical protein